MPIDPSVAKGAHLSSRVISWTATDVLLYNIAVGAGSDPLDLERLRFAYEKDLQVLPTFATSVPDFRDTEPPRITFPGIDVDLLRVVLGIQSLTVFRPIPVAATVIVRERIADVFDKGSGAIIARETNVYDLDGEPMWTSTMNIFAKGEGGFGGSRGPFTRVDIPERSPDFTVDTRTLPQQALLFRLCGDRNPMHADPVVARAQGFEYPFLHGLGIYGIIGRVLVEDVLACDSTRLRSWTARFVAPVRPGETLRTLAWATDYGYLVRVLSLERNTPVLEDGILIARN